MELTAIFERALICMFTVNKHDSTGESEVNGNRNRLFGGEQST